MATKNAQQIMASPQTFSHVLSFEGRLCATDGKPVPDGPYAVVFTIYDAETDGTALWNETQDVTQVGGVFIAYLGTVTPFPTNLFADGDRWLGVKVGADPEMAQRFRFTPAPWAMHAATAGTDNDWTVSGDNVYRETGNVGIGTTTPAAPLDVAGTVRVTGFQMPTGAVDGYALKSDGSGVGAWQPDGLSLPYDGSASTESGSHALEITNLGGGDAIAGSHSASGSFGILGGPYYGVQGSGSKAGGYFEEPSGCYAYIAHGYGNAGIEAYGTYTGGYLKSLGYSGAAYIAHGDYGMVVYGNTAAGRFSCSAGSGLAELGAGNYGITANGQTCGGYFQDSNSSGYGYVGYSSYKIAGSGSVSFVQNHPEDPDKVIVYACPEGDEVATYTRGTAKLVNGKAVVPLGETFKWVTNPDIGLTAHLTPRGKAVPLAVVSLTTTGLVVCGPDDGPQDLAFDYIVYGLRIGFEEASIVQEKKREAYIPSMANHRELYARRPELRQYNALERFQRMRLGLGESRPLDLTASRALHDAIVEFDPAVHRIADPEGLEPRELPR
jgi:hypothetical protein